MKVWELKHILRGVALKDEDLEIVLYMAKDGEGNHRLLEGDAYAYVDTAKISPASNISNRDFEIRVGKTFDL